MLGSIEADEEACASYDVVTTISGGPSLEEVTAAVVGTGVEAGTAVLPGELTAGVLTGAMVEERTPVLELRVGMLLGMELEEAVPGPLTPCGMLLGTPLETPVPGPLTPAGTLLGIGLAMLVPETGRMLLDPGRVVPGALLTAVALTIRIETGS